MAALQHPNRVSKLVIINAPHPFIFQKTMFDDPAQRAASQYIRAFRNPDLEKHIAEIGLSSFFDGSFLRHTDFSKIADEKPVYLEQWGQPGAMTAMLNWYRASAVVVPGAGETAPCSACSEESCWDEGCATRHGGFCAYPSNTCLCRGSAASGV